MRELFRIKSITHSGRKGIRGDPVTDPKYEDIIGSIAVFDPNKSQQFKPMRFTFYDNRLYDWWTTSETLALGWQDEKTLILETVNTIYEFEKVENERSD